MQGASDIPLTMGNRIYTLVLIGTLTLAASSCKNRRIERAVIETIGREITWERTEPDSSAYRFTIIRYIDNPVCTSCQLHMGDWRVYRRRMQNAFGDGIDYVFVINTTNTDEARDILEMYDFDDHAIVGKDISLIENNGLTDDLGKDFVLLLDSARRVVSIGNPCETPKAEENFNRIFSGQMKITD